MLRSYLHRLTTPGAFPQAQVCLASICAMTVAFGMAWSSPGDIRLPLLCTFPLAAIAVHCERKSLVIVGLVLAVVYQLIASLRHDLPAIHLAIDALIYIPAFMLVLFLGRAVREWYFEIENLATTDWLTGLENRQSFEFICDLEIARQERYGGVFSLAMLDLDNFKALNDSRGHRYGDIALTLLADVLREQTRRSDTIARLGGDEFVVLMPNTGARDCGSLCQLLSAKIADSMANSGFAITASIGYATFGHAPESTSSALLHADKAMYAAKKNGKGRVANL